MAPESNQEQEVKIIVPGWGYLAHSGPRNGVFELRRHLHDRRIMWMGGALAGQGVVISRFNSNQSWVWQWPEY